MAAPIWVTKSSLGIVKNLTPCYKPLIATQATSYQLISGSLPPGLSLNLEGEIIGIPDLKNIVANKLGSQFSFTIRAFGGGGASNRSFDLYVIANDIYVPDQITSISRCRVGADFLQYQIVKGDVNVNNNIYWRFEDGILPPGTSLFPDGIIEISTGSPIAPLTLNQFIVNGPGIAPIEISDTLQKSWDDWLLNYIKNPVNKDYQFRLTLSDGFNPAQLSVSVRVLIIPAPVDSDWFIDNSSILTIDTNREYIFFAVSDVDYITWKTDSNLGSAYNGSVSEFGLEAVSNAGKKLIYSIKPLQTSRLPQRLTLADNGLITGRISFRCYLDDPVDTPVNDNYAFTVRASTVDRSTYSEKTFNLHIERFHDKPYNNIWIRAFPPLEQRILFNQLISNNELFPENLLYRPKDVNFGKLRHLRFLAVAGVEPATTSEYYETMMTNHYTKELAFGDIKTAIAYDENLNIKHEVVYVPFIDYAQITNFKNNTTVTQPNIIDLRNLIKNFFYKEDQLYYEFEPNGLENMRRIFGELGFRQSGVLPRWMASVQPVPGMAGQFYQPLGFVPGIVLAYTIPGASANIAYRLKLAGINFNQLFRFEFDRYELDDNLLETFDLTTKSFLAAGQQTTFDSGTTFFEQGSTKFNSNLDYSTIETDRDPDYGTKYLKFPKTGVFV